MIVKSKPQINGLKLSKKSIPLPGPMLGGPDGPGEHPKADAARLMALGLISPFRPISD